jgi:hypothetical protein
MQIGQKVKTLDSTCEAKVFRIDGDKIYIHMAWYAKLDYISDYHQYEWFDRCVIEPFLEA